LFTAISRLKAVHEKIKLPLNDEDIPLYAQHMDNMDAGTLVDIFRDDEHACTLLHKARREAFGQKQYDERLTRMKLKQAYGRLIRRADDKGIFVMLDSGMPSRLNGAFPEGVEIERVGLADAITKTKEFLHD